MKPLMIELFAGLHGWGEGAVSEGYRVVGFDIVDMCKELGHKRPEGIDLVLQDVKTLHGAQFKNAAAIVASPPCQAYSYRAMPWKRAKALPPPDNTLFDACFRIQREASEAAGRYIPMVVENVKGAQPWVGRAKWHFGSYYLWGDVPALMPITFQLKQPGRNFHFPEKYIPSPSFHGAAHESSVQRAEAVKQQGSPGQTETGQNPVNMRLYDERPTKGMSGLRGMSHPTDAHLRDLGGPNDPRRFNSRSTARKAASAQIARIPFPLAQHIARVFKPDDELRKLRS